MRNLARSQLLILLVAGAMPACVGMRNAEPKRAVAQTAESHWEFVNVEVAGGKTAHYWRLSDVGVIYEAPMAGEGGCGDGMVRVEGRMKRDDPKKGPVEFLQDSTCTDWMDPPKHFPRRCRSFDRAKWEKIAETLPTKAMPPFCMDRYEYPNIKGQNPAIDMNWFEAKAICESGGKRLCTEDEWTFACEGTEALPYAYGYERSADACNIDRPWLDFNKQHLSPREQAGPGLEQLWGGEPSGARPGCASPFGVYDMNGNVDEWTTSVSRSGFRSILKGGYWSVVRTRCRPATRAHNEAHEFYQQGFRCCSSL